MAFLRAVLMAGSLASIAYLIAATACVSAFGRRRRDACRGDALPPVTILKPVCGAEPGLYENLRSFCDQDHPEFQVVFGAGEADDPAIPVVRRVMAAFPSNTELAVGGRETGGNRKAALLAHMLPLARHDLVAASDSDMRVGRGYLRAVAAPFADPGVGAVTCLYRGTPAGGLPSALGALYINDWFFPSVLTALSFQELRFCTGATMAVRREALGRIGGFEALVPLLADDHELGKRVAALGYEVRLSPYVVENIVFEPDLAALLRHELRWARTVRACRPRGYAGLFLGNNAIALSAACLAASGATPPGLAIAAAALGMRILLHYRVRSAAGVSGPPLPLLLPLRDLMCLAVWAAGFAGRTVSWKDRRLSFDADGKLDAPDA